MSKNKILVMILFIVTILTLSSCAFVQRSTTMKKIVTTLYAEYDMINKIIGDDKETQNLYEVEMIIKPGQDSHTYDPSINDLITIKNADLFIYTAIEMETWVSDIDFLSDTKVIDLSKDKRIELLTVEDETEEEHDHDHSYEHNHAHVYDPHYWIYPIYATYMVEQIKDAIISITPDPDGTKTRIFEKNASEYINILLKYDQALKILSENAKNKTMYFGSPFSFYYISHFYEFEYELIYETCSTETEPSIEVLQEIINKMNDNDINVIFSKELINKQACEMISYHTGATILELHSGHNVSALDFNNKELSYLSIFKQNIINLAKMLKVDDNIIKDLWKEEA